MDKFEEYKLFVEDTARFSERRQTVNNIYVAINSIVLSAIAFLLKDGDFTKFWQNAVVIFVLAAGIVICLQWERLIYKYKELVRFRIDQLRIIEDHEKMTGCHHMYHEEDILYPRDENGDAIPKKSLNISDRERWLPRVFIIIYSIFFFGLLVS